MVFPAINACPLVTIHHMPWGDPVEDSQTLWRYMSYPKFLHLLHFQTLFFSRLDRMTDLFDGHLSRSAFDALSKEMRAIGANPIGAGRDWRRHHLAEQAAQRQLNSYINCWHMNDVESEAMWVLYGAKGAAVAIKTTFGRLYRAVDPVGDLFVGAVSYEPYTPEHGAGNFLAPLFHKRKSFQHERELRLVVHEWEKTSEADHRLVPLKLSDLLVSVHVAPTTHSEIVSAVKGLLDRYSLSSVPVNSSILDEEPVYGRTP